MELLLKNGYIIDAKGESYGDIWIRDGNIAEVGKDLIRPGQSVNLAGKVVLPGLVDLHAHLREPGQEGKETIATGTAAAAGGGRRTGCPCVPDSRGNAGGYHPHYGGYGGGRPAPAR